MRATYASGEELTWRRRDGGGDDDRDDARTNDGLTGIEHARTAQGRLGLPRTARSDSLKLKQRGNNDASSDGEYSQKQISTP